MWRATLDQVECLQARVSEDVGQQGEFSDSGESAAD